MHKGHFFTDEGEFHNDTDIKTVLLSPLYRNELLNVMTTFFNAKCVQNSTNLLVVSEITIVVAIKLVNKDF